MAVTFKNAGSGVTFSGNTASPAPNGTSPTADDMSLMQIAVKPETATIDTPANWTHIGTRTGGTGTFGADTGPTKVAMYYREGAFSGAQSVTSSGVDDGAVWILTGQRTLGAWAPIVFTSGTDDVDGDNVTWEATMDANPGVVEGDWLVGAIAIPTNDASAFVSGAIVATGLSGGNTAQFLVVAGVSNACALGHIRRQAFTGAASAAATVSGNFTGSTNSYGPCVLARLRDVTVGPYAILRPVVVAP